MRACFFLTNIRARACGCTCVRGCFWSIAFIYVCLCAYFFVNTSHVSAPVVVFFSFRAHMCLRLCTCHHIIIMLMCLYSVR